MGWIVLGATVLAASATAALAALPDQRRAAGVRGCLGPDRQGSHLTCLGGTAAQPGRP